MKKKHPVIWGMFVMVFPFLLNGCSEKDAIQEQSDDKIELTFFSQKREMQDFFNEVIEEFNASQDRIKVVHINNPYTEQYLKIHASENNLPDIIQTVGVQDARTALYVENDFFMPLTDMECTNRIKEVYRNISYYQGEIYTLPVSANVIGIYVNMDLLNEYGFETPTTWDEWMAQMKKVQEQGKHALLLTDGDSWSTQSIFNNMIVSIKDSDSAAYFETIEKVALGQTAFEEESVWLQVVEDLKEMHTYANEDYMTLSYDDAILRFLNGEILYFCQGSWALPSILQKNPDMNVQMIPFPTDRYQVGISMDMSLAISRNCEYVEEAEEFLNYFLSREVAQRYIDEEYSVSCVNDVEDGGTYYFQEVYQEIERGDYAYETFSMPEEFYDYLINNIARLFYTEGEVKTEEFLRECTKIFQDKSESYFSD